MLLALAHAGATWADAGHAWATRFGLPSIDGEVLCATRYRGGIAVAGDFQLAGGVAVRNVAWWDGTQWHALGDGVFGFPLCCFARGDTLILGNASLTLPLSDAQPNVVRWTGTKWESMGAGLDGLIRQFVTLHDTLVAVGNFRHAGSTAVSSVAWWDGTAWRSFGKGLNYGAMAGAVYHDRLFVAGWFDTAGTVPANGFAAWNGAEWAAVPWDSTPTGRVTSLAVAHDRLYAGGTFYQIGTLPARGLARWDGSAWSAVPENYYGSIWALAAHGDSLYVADGDSVLIWDGTMLLPSAPGLRQGSIRALHADAAGLIAAGQFYAIDPSSGATVGEGVLTSDGGPWRPLASWNPDMHGLGPPRSRITALARYRGAIVAAGEFVDAGDGTRWIPLRGLAAWDGTRWQAFPGWTGGGLPTALLAREDTLWVFGGFPYGSRPGLRYDGATWTRLDTLGISVQAATIYRGSIYVAGSSGDFLSPVAGGVWRLDDTTWTRVGTTDGDGYESGPHALLVHGDRLILGGRFTTVDGVGASDIAAWDGAHWNPVGGPSAFGGPYHRVLALAEDDGALCAGGTSLEGFAAVVRLEAGSWVPVGDLEDRVDCLESFGGRLYAGGVLYAGSDLGGLAAWNGAGWGAVGGGVLGEVNALLPDGASLWAGGEFSRAGDVPSFGVARWDSVAASSGEVPIAFSTGAPNPFQSAIDFAYELATGGSVSITVSDAAGRHVATLESGTRPPGVHTVHWDGRADSGRRLPAGMYFVHIVRPDGRSATHKAVLLR